MVQLQDTRLKVQLAQPLALLVLHLLLEATQLATVLTVLLVRTRLEAQLVHRALLASHLLLEATQLATVLTVMLVRTRLASAALV